MTPKINGNRCTAVNARLVKPLDDELLFRLLPGHSLMVTVEDHAVQGGVGSAVLEFMADTGLSAQKIVVRLGIDDEFVEHGTRTNFTSCAASASGRSSTGFGEPHARRISEFIRQLALSRAGGRQLRLIPVPPRHPQGT